MPRFCTFQSAIYRCLMMLPCAVVAGCASPPPRAQTGVAVEAYGTGELQVGEPGRDFLFRDANDCLARFTAVRGRVTVLLFPADPNWPDCADTQRLADMAQRASTSYVGVVVVSVGRPPAPCAEALRTVAACVVWPETIVLICDPFGRIDKLYGSDAVGRYYVVNNFLKIVAGGELSDFDSLRADTRRAVETIADQDMREGLYEMFGDHCR